MQRAVTILACLFYLNCCSQSPGSGGQYPFVHYTPKDGLISNQVRNIYQDSKGRIYFTSFHGLSIYDGSRFINYNSRNGLNYDLVNCVMEMGDDSIWVVTNRNKIQCLVKGKLRPLELKQDNYIINNLCKDSKGNLYAAAEEGLLLFDKDHFTRLPLINSKGADISRYISYLFSLGNYLLLQRDNSMLSEAGSFLYLYDKQSKKIVAEMNGVIVVTVAPDGRVWGSTEKNIISVDTNEIKKGRLVLQELPAAFSILKDKARYFVLFDNGNNCWLGDQNSALIKATPDGNITTFTAASGLNMFFMSFIFQDREGVTWIATNNDGVSKLVHSNFSQIEKPFGMVYPSDISYDKNTGNLLIYSAPTSGAVIVHNDVKKFVKIQNGIALNRVIETKHGFYGLDRNTIYKLELKNNILFPKAILSGSFDNIYADFLPDQNGNLIVPGKYHLNAIINGKTIYKTKLPFFADLPALDSKGNIWVATRANDIIMYQTHPGDPSNYLEQKLFFKKGGHGGISPRSIVIDKHDHIWIGTRNDGIHVFTVSKGQLMEKFSLSTAAGLSDEFITHLTCDEDNNIWASSALGLDKITIKNGKPVIENITRQNNIYKTVFRVVSENSNNVWALVSNGLIRITPEKRTSYTYEPSLIVSMVKAGKDTITGNASLTHDQNNISFNFAATSFLNERQILYSYRLHGGSNNQWSDPLNNASVSFIDLRPGDYDLEIRAIFPAGTYPDKIVNYRFSISPPWWQSWWFRIVAALLVIALVIMGFRFYYRRKLERQMAVLEKQQAIEKERTRIATDMHDDLGAGLSRIKFLSETIGIKKQQHQPIEEDVSKIRAYAHEMIDKMGEIVWALNEKNDSLSDLLSYIRVYAMEYLSQNGISCKAEIPGDIPPVFLSGEFRRNVFLTIKEALHNVVKHAEATEVKLETNVNHQLFITLKDNGAGFDANHIRPFSNGLTNMEARIKEIGGKIGIENNNGTLISLSIPLMT